MDSFDQEILALFVCLTHLFCFFHTVHGSQCTSLQKAAGAADGMLEQLQDNLIHRSIAGKIAQTPSGHGTAFGKTIDDDNPIEKFRNRSKADNLLLIIYDFLINFIG